jgi:WD40 repeat protein
LPVDESVPTPVPSHGSQVTVLDVGPNVAAWGFADGTVAVHQHPGQDWVFPGHPAAINFVFFSPDGRQAIAIGGREVRGWNLAPLGTVLPTLPCRPFNVALSDDGAYLAVDCSSGAVHVLDLRDSELRKVHRHSTLSFGVVWRGAEVCSAGWDGRVLCTNVETNTTTEIAKYSVPLRWIARSKASGSIAYVVADGGIWVHADGAPRLIHSHQGEPYRVAFSPDGRYIASGDRDGVVMLSNLDGGGTVTRKQHESLITSVVWASDGLLSSSLDGKAVRWSRDLEVLAIDGHGLPLRYPMVDGNSLANWVATVGNTQLLRVGPAGPQYLELGSSITAMHVVPEKWIAIGTSTGEFVLVDSSLNTVASIPFSSSQIQDVCMVGDTAYILFAEGTGYRIRASALEFERLGFHNKG